MKHIVATALLATVIAGPAVAQTAEFKCPAVGTQFTHKSGAVETLTTAAGQDGTACVSARTVGGKAEGLRTHWGLIGSVDAQGEAFASGVDLKSLWPLKVGNKTTSTVTVTRDGKGYTSTVTVTVAAYEKVTVPAGTFDAFRVEESKTGETTPRIHWWAPSVSQSVKESFPDWRDRSKLVIYELTAVKAAAK